MDLLRYLIRPYLLTRYQLHVLTGTGPSGKKGAQGVPKTVKPGWSRLKQAVWNCHVKQFHDASCSVASVVTCLNAIQSVKNGSSPRIHQQEILERVKTGHWKERMGPNGYNGRRGLPLPLLGRVVEDSLTVYRISVTAMDVVQVPQRGPNRPSVEEELKQRLRDFDVNGKGLIIAHFDQGTLIPTLNIPHISPVGAYDSKSEEVTLLDVDQDLKEPYKVPFTRFCKGLSCNYHHVFRAFGYGSGGYVYIEL